MGQNCVKVDHDERVNDINAAVKKNTGRNSGRSIDWFNVSHDNKFYKNLRRIDATFCLLANTNFSSSFTSNTNTAQQPLHLHL
jgi:hypothetical protein